MNNKHLPTSLLLIAIASTGCAGLLPSPQQPASFNAQSPKDTTVDETVLALAEQGLEAQKVDRGAGVIHTKWVDTGYMYGQVQKRTATLVKRYTVTVRESNSGSAVTVRADVRRCAQGGFFIDGDAITGPCEPLDGLIAKDQGELSELGAQIEAALAR